MAVATVLMTVVILVFGEVLPKTLAIARTDRFALTVAWPVRKVVSILGPIVDSCAISRLEGVRCVRSPAGGGMRRCAPAHEEIRGTVELHHKEGGVEREHRDMIGGILDLRELTLEDVMTHRKNITTADADQPPKALLEEVMKSRHSARAAVARATGKHHRHPSYHGHVIERSQRHGAIDGSDFMGLAGPAWFAPETTALEEQLEAFRERRSHFALVVDEYGVLQGLVTFEDIVDEIFGEIPDQDQDRQPPGIRPQTDGSVQHRRLNADPRGQSRAGMGTARRRSHHHRGLRHPRARAIPEVGQRFAFFGYQFEILRRQRNQITAVRVVPPVKANATPQPSTA